MTSKINDLKQVEKSHYEFSEYVQKHRWVSIYHQLDEVLKLNPSTVLEVGPGPGLFKLLAGHFGMTVETVDIDPELNPDYVASATELPFADNSYDCVCAFQMLEHLPYELFVQAFSEMVRVAKDSIVISLPDAKNAWTFSVQDTSFRRINIQIPKPTLRPLPHDFDGEHYWEINKRGYPLGKIIGDLTKNNVDIVTTYRVDECLYHRFFVLKK